MNKAALYRKNNKITRCTSQELMQEFASRLKWRSDGRDSVLDAGCGPGDVTLDIVLPALPSTFERLVGIDISEDMLDYARKTQVHPKLSFEQFNLGMELEKQSLNGIEPFDHITSFFCLMWIRNQKICIRNFHKLLKPGGDMVIAFIKHHVVYDAYEHLSQDIRWAEYMVDYEQQLSPYHNSKNAREEFSNLLKDCGFTEYDVRVDEKKFTFDGDEARGKNFYIEIQDFLSFLFNWNCIPRFVPFCESIYRPRSGSGKTGISR